MGLQWNRLFQVAELGKKLILVHCSFVNTMRCLSRVGQIGPWDPFQVVWTTNQLKAGSHIHPARWGFSLQQGDCNNLLLPKFSICAQPACPGNCKVWAHQMDGLGMSSPFPHQGSLSFVLLKETHRRRGSLHSNTELHCAWQPFQKVIRQLGSLLLSADFGLCNLCPFIYIPSLPCVMFWNLSPTLRPDR